MTSLLCIYKAIFEHRLSYMPWKTFAMVVLHKPGKPRYDVPKAYRLIALLNTIWKVLTAIIADQLTFISEKHHLLPDNHFRGRPRCTTMDAMYLIANIIKLSWRAGKVMAVLFLDIEGAFPNAVPSDWSTICSSKVFPERSSCLCTIYYRTESPI